MSGATPILLIVREIETLANAHGQVKTFKYGQFLDIIKDTTINYALCHANIRSANKNENSNVIQIELSLMDKTRGDDSNLFDVESNTYQIFIDLFNIISYSPRWQTLGVVNSSSAPQKFLNRGADVVTGWGAVIQFEIYEGLGFCDVPVYGYDYDAPIVPVEGPGKYQNSDLSFVQLIDPGDTFTAPDISFTDSDGTVSAKAANTDIVATPGTTVSGILYNRPVYPGWRTSFANYDEAWQKANGTYDYTKTDPAIIARLNFSVTNAFFFLTEANSFGNLARFTDENGEYYTDPFNSASKTDPSAFATDYIIDHLTGLGWRRTKISGNWATLLSSAESQTFATFSDWRIPTIYELFSLVNCDTDALIVGSRKTGLEWYPFDQPTAAEYNSITTNAGNTSEIYTYFSGVTATLSVNLNRNPKTLNAPAFTVRNHFT